MSPDLLGSFQGILVGLGSAVDVSSFRVRRAVKNEERVRINSGAIGQEKSWLVAGTSAAKW